MIIYFNFFVFDVEFREVVPDNEDSSDAAISPCETPVLPPKLSHSKSVDASNDDVHSSPSSAASTLTKKKIGLRYNLNLS